MGCKVRGQVLNFHHGSLLDTQYTVPIFKCVSYSCMYVYKVDALKQAEIFWDAKSVGRF